MKRILSLGFIIIALGFFYFSQNNKSKKELSVKPSEKVEKNEIDQHSNIFKLTQKGKKKFKEKLSKEISESDILNNVLDFSIPVEKIITDENSKKILKKHINQAIPEILDCLPTLCGAERTQDGLISESGSLAHESIERYLELIIELQKKNEGDFLTDDTIIEIASIENSNIQKLIVEIVGNDISDQHFSRPFLDKFNGEALSKLVQRISLISKKQSIEILKDSLEKNNSYNIIELAKGLKDLNYTKDEVENLAPHICHLKNIETEKHNYLMAKMYFNKKATSLNFEIDWVSTCP
jgi:hypothetical protein